MPRDKHTGSRSELLASVWLSQQGYEVFRNVSCYGPADLIAWNPISDETIKVDVKTIKGIPYKRPSDGERVIYYTITKTRAHDNVRRLFVMEDGSVSWTPPEMKGVRLKEAEGG